jgi:hypothetical protein
LEFPGLPFNSLEGGNRESPLLTYTLDDMFRNACQGSNQIAGEDNISGVKRSESDELPFTWIVEITDLSLFMISS